MIKKEFLDLHENEIYFFNPKNKELHPFKAKFIMVDIDSKWLVIEDLKFKKRKRFSFDFLENVEDLRE